MDKLFDLDNPIMQALSKIADLMILNVLVLVSSLPIITIGAAQTGLYYAIGRRNNQTGHIWKDYWGAFRSNFKQATLLWLIFLGSGALGAAVILLHSYAQTSISGVALIILSAVSLLWLGALTWVFPLQSKFQNTLINTFRNAIRCTVIEFPKTIIMIVLTILPLVLYFGIPTAFAVFCPVLLIVWFSCVASINLSLMKKVFSIES